ncbi:MAG: hypothetical protein V1924_06250 [Candidatus Bathyarchaeota archaeon]
MDVLIKNGIIVTMDPTRRVIMDGAVAVDKDRIIDIGSLHELEKSHSTDPEIEAGVGRSGLKDLYETTDRYWGHSKY